MSNRIEVKYAVSDARAKVRKKELLTAGFTEIKEIALVDVYTFDLDLNEEELKKSAEMLSNPVLQEYSIGTPLHSNEFNYAIEIGFLPGVTDNIGSTAKEAVQDLLKKKFEEGKGIYSSQIIFIKGKNSKEQKEKEINSKELNKSINEIANSLFNPLIQRAQIKSFEEFQKENGMDLIIPKVELKKEISVDEVDLELNEKELIKLGKEGIPNKDGTRRGPLALSLYYLKAIQEYFEKEKRKPTDIELESLAQTWSEHCKHTIFADPIDELKEGLFKTYIRGATERIKKEKKGNDFCVSVFKDNSGAIEFDENYLITDKAETHNSPSALDPFGGAITGIVGVNRDTIGFGLGAKPIINKYGYCFADPKDAKPLFKGENFSEKMLSPKRILEGVVSGVRVGGNCSGIPCPQGFMYFNERFKGKPLVFVGTVGLIPKESAGRLSHEKKAMPGNLIVMIGGRVGQDGIHGATFSSEAMDAKSPMGAVQIGDPITQKKFSDAIVKEARDKELYNSITDNGAGGLSCSVAEMAKESKGCHVNLELVPLKYPNLEPWKIWVSESQERMTLAVPKHKWWKLKELMDKRGVEATVIGKFTDSGKCIVEFNGEKIMDLKMDFLHEGLPKIPLKSVYEKPVHEEPEFEEEKNLTQALHEMISRLNIAGNEFISMQYDHEVQGGSVIKPLQGKGRVNGEATVTRPLLNSDKAVVLSQALNPSYSDIDTYHMSACAIDSAIRNAVAAGANLDNLALLDNFCWCSSDEMQKLGELKSAVKACYDYAVIYGTPFISGKDSMFNDFKGFDEKGNSVKISVPPTLLISSIGVIENALKSVSIDFKFSGDLIYILGETFNEMGATEFYAMKGEKLIGKKFIGNNVPKVDAEKNKKLYNALSKCIEKELIASAKSVHLGGLGIALAKSAMAGMLGAEISLENMPGKISRNDYALFSESQGRILVSIAPENKEEFEFLMKGNEFTLIGKAMEGNEFIVKGLNGEKIVNTKVSELLKDYKKTFEGY
ncbi:MAG: AIR synthase-related protein [Candidatus Diapherotrites archaeon]